MFPDSVTYLLESLFSPDLNRNTDPSSIARPEHVIKISSRGPVDMPKFLSAHIRLQLLYEACSI